MFVLDNFSGAKIRCQPVHEIGLRTKCIYTRIRPIHENCLYKQVAIHEFNLHRKFPKTKCRLIHEIVLYTKCIFTRNRPMHKINLYRKSTCTGVHEQEEYWVTAWSTRLGHISVGRVAYYADQVLAFVAVGAECLTRVPGRPSIHISQLRQAFLEPQEAVPSGSYSLRRS